MRPLLSGLMAVALGDEEQYVVAPLARRRGGSGDVSAVELGALRPYEILAVLKDLPVVVIQSSNDRYLPAAQARGLFGPDGAWRHFYTIPARSHTFGGAREALYGRARLALEWIASPWRAPEGIPTANVHE